MSVVSESGAWACRLDGRWPGWSDVGRVDKSGLTSVGVCWLDHDCVPCKFQAAASCVRVGGIRLQQWRTLDPHAEHYSEVIKGSW